MVEFKRNQSQDRLLKTINVPIRKKTNQSFTSKNSNNYLLTDLSETETKNSQKK